MLHKYIAGRFQKESATFTRRILSISICATVDEQRHGISELDPLADAAASQRTCCPVLNTQFLLRDAL